MMNLRIAALSMSLLALLTGAAAAQAGELPPIKVTDDNAVMSCATPGRLMAYLKSNNSKLPDQFEGIATEYMRHGETLGIRWDYAFFQMLVETGYLKFTGDVDVKQNNFAGLGATGKGAKGESFPDVATGVKAHLQHIVMYTGTPVDDPVAQRTRDVQAWGVLTKWQKTIKRPMTFKDLTSKWAPTSKAYPRDIVSVGERFEKGPCQQDDPQPELVADARGQAGSPTGQANDKSDTAAATSAPVEPTETASVEPAAPPADTEPKTAAAASTAAEGGAKLDLKVINQADGAKAESGAPSAPDAAPKTEAPTKAAALPSASTLPDKTQGKGAAVASDKKAATSKTFETAAMTGVGATAPAATAAAKCKVWQASYGGAKAIIIKAQADKMTNYTVLDVNDGAEKREAEAYIAAYAKGGSTVGEYASSAQALEKAFELCPEG
jgi:hypothetical protein